MWPPADTPVVPLAYTWRTTIDDCGLLLADMIRFELINRPATLLTLLPDIPSAPPKLVPPLFPPPLEASSLVLLPIILLAETPLLLLLLLLLLVLPVLPTLLFELEFDAARKACGDFSCAFS